MIVIFNNGSITALDSSHLRINKFPFNLHVIKLWNLKLLLFYSDCYYHKDSMPSVRVVFPIIKEGIIIILKAAQTFFEVQSNFRLMSFNENINGEYFYHDLRRRRIP